jgi:hypothetical protein
MTPDRGAYRAFRCDYSPRAERGESPGFHGSPPVFPRFEILADEPQRHRVNGNKPDLVALAFDAQMHDALAALHIAQAQQAEFFAADAVIEQGGENGAVAPSLQRVRGRGLQQSPGLCIAKRWRTALIIIRSRSLYAVHGIAGYGIALAEIIEERRQGGELAADAGGLQLARLQILGARR